MAPLSRRRASPRFLVGGLSGLVLGLLEDGASLGPDGSELLGLEVLVGTVGGSVH